VVWGLLAGGHWTEQRGSNLLDGGAPWYDTYETLDGQHMSIGPIEARFYAEMLEILGLTGADLPRQHDRAGWPRLREAFTAAFLSRTRAQWAEAFANSDACVVPVLGLAEAAKHPHSVARGSFIEVDGVVQPVPAPRFQGTPSAQPRPAPQRGEHGDEALRDWGFDTLGIERLRELGLGFKA
jgi:alpha-methylacyl-CoA racemase